MRRLVRTFQILLGVHRVHLSRLDVNWLLIPVVAFRERPSTAAQSLLVLLHQVDVLNVHLERRIILRTTRFDCCQVLLIILLYLFFLQRLNLRL